MAHMVTRVLSIRPTQCVECGDAERLITVTVDAVMSCCYSCGDTSLGRSKVGPASAVSSVTAPPPRRFQPTAAA